MGGTPNQDPLAFLSRLGETFQGVKLGRGYVARSGTAMLGVLAVWAVIAWRWTDNLVMDGGLLLVGAIATGAFLAWSKSTRDFARDNPAQAMLEGAEFVEYKKFEVQAQGITHQPGSDVMTEVRGGK